MLLLFLVFAGKSCSLPPLKGSIRVTKLDSIFNVYFNCIFNILIDSWGFLRLGALMDRHTIVGSLFSPWCKWSEVDHNRACLMSSLAVWKSFFTAICFQPLPSAR